MTPDAQLLRDLKRAGLELRSARARRDDLIICGRLAGIPVRKLAHAAGIAPQTVLNIMKRNHQ